MTQLEVAKADTQFMDEKIESINGQESIDDMVVVEFTDSGCIGVQNELGARPLVAGDTLRLFGKGFGYTVRGIGLVENGELTALYRYRTEEEDKAHHTKNVADSHAKKKADWEERKEATAAEIKAMPEVFQKRIEFFMRNIDWGWDFGPYELFACKEAIKLAEALKTSEGIRAFHAASYEEQLKMVPGVSPDHSGNTMGAALSFANVYLTKPEFIPQMHGALCPLVGCKDYGCYASTIEQMEVPDEDVTPQ